MPKHKVGCNNFLCQSKSLNYDYRKVKAYTENTVQWSEIEKEIYQDIEVRWKWQEVQLQQDFERHLEEQVGKVFEDQKKVLEEERKQFLIELENARGATEAALRMVDEAKAETKMLSDLLEQSKLQTKRIEKEAARAAQNAEEAFNEQMNKLLLELEQTTKKAMKVTKVAKEMSQKLMMAQAQNMQWHDTEEKKIVHEYEQHFEQQEHHFSLKLAMLKKLADNQTEEVWRLTKMVNIANMCMQQAEEHASTTAERAEKEVQKACRWAADAERRATEIICTLQPAPTLELRKLSDIAETANLGAQQSENNVAIITEGAEEEIQATQLLHLVQPISPARNQNKSWNSTEENDLNMETNNNQEFDAY